MSSIRRFLLIVLLAALTLFNFVAALQGYRSSLSETEKLFDQQLIEIAELLYELAEAQPDVEHERAFDNPRVISERQNLAFQVWHDDKLVQHSANSPNRAISSQPGFAYDSFSGFRWRTYQIDFQANNTQLENTHIENTRTENTRTEKKAMTIMVAERNDLRFVLAENVILHAVLPVVLGMPLIGLLVWLVVGRGLKPLNQLAGELSRKKPEDLSRLPTENIPKELQVLVQSTNNLLVRLDASFKREKRLTSDAAHELRTPLSVLKLQIHNLASELPKGSESLQNLNRSVDNMSHLIEQILDLYRTTPDQFTGNFTQLNLEELAQQMIAELYPRLESKQQNIELEADSDTRLQGDEFSLRLLLKNLVDNASKYTPEQGQVRVSIKHSTAGLLLVVEDSGPGIKPELYERVFERFYRVDGDKHASKQTGCGLGLAIIRHIVELHGATIALGKSESLGGLAVTVCFCNSRKTVQGKQPESQQTTGSVKTEGKA